MPKTQLFPHVSLELPCKKSHVQVVKKHFFHFHAKNLFVLFYNFRMFKQGKAWLPSLKLCLGNSKWLLANLS